MDVRVKAANGIWRFSPTFFFVVFFVLFSVFLFNLFVSFLVGKYNKKEKKEKISIDPIRFCRVLNSNENNRIRVKSFNFKHS